MPRTAPSDSALLFRANDDAYALFYGFTWLPARIVRDVKPGAKTALVETTTSPLQAPRQSRVPIEKIAHPHEKLCIVFQRSKSKAVASCRLERTLYPSSHRLAHQISRSFGGPGRVDEP